MVRSIETGKAQDMKKAIIIGATSGIGKELAKINGELEAHRTGR
jgi:short-subunit dehydrogenase